MLSVAGGLVAHIATSGASTTTTTTGRGFVGQPFTVLLDDPKIIGTRSDGRAVFRNRRNHSVRVVITLSASATGSEAVILGGQTPGIAHPRTDCDVVVANTDPNDERLNEEFPIRYRLGMFLGRRYAFEIQSATIRQIRRRTQSIAVVKQYLLWCGDL